MRRNCEKRSLAICQQIALACKSVQAIRVNNHRNLRIANYVPDKLLCFRVDTKTGPESKNALSLKNLSESTGIHTRGGDGPVFC